MQIEKIKLSSDDYEKLITSNSNIFNSTMLDIFYKRAKNVQPAFLLKNYQNKSDMYAPSKIDPRVYNEISNIFFDSVANDFECIELSPINPFGLNSSLTKINQNNVLSSLRNSEVISDSSIAMSLECAYRIKKLKINEINLASSTRLLRTQKYGNGKKLHWSQHFRACSLVSSFRNIHDNMFLSLVLQIDNWLNTIKNLKENLNIEKISVNLCYIPLVKEIYKTHGINFEEVLSNTVNPEFDAFLKHGINLPNNIERKSDIDLIKTTKKYISTIKNSYTFFDANVIEPLKNKHSDVNYNLQLNRKSGLTYYNGICYEIEVLFENGQSLVLVDGGVTDWIGKILSDSKAKCITSGMGLEYLGKVYKKVL